MKRDLAIVFLLSVILVQWYFLFFRGNPYTKIYDKVYEDGREIKVVDYDKRQAVIESVPEEIQDTIIGNFIFAPEKELSGLLRTIGEDYWKMDAAEIVLCGRGILQKKDAIMKRRIQVPAHPTNLILPGCLKK